MRWTSKSGDARRTQSVTAVEAASGGVTNVNNGEEALREIERRAWADPEFVEEIEETQRQSGIRPR